MKLWLVYVVFCILSQCNVKSETFCSDRFPSNLLIAEGQYINWAKQTKLTNVWTSTPRTVSDIVTLANWAVEHGYNIRPRGQMHGWSPLLVTGEEEPCSSIVLVDTTRFLTNMQMISPTAVKVQAGVLMEDLLAFLEVKGHGILCHPAPGDVTVGGVIAIGGHGTGVKMPGQVGNHGTLSNLVRSIDLIVWNDLLGQFEVQTFDRSHPDARALILNLGRLFITEVTLEVTPLTFMRCQSRVDLPASLLYADPSDEFFSTNTSLTSFLDIAGTVETIWFPFTPNPWLKVWTVAETQPLLSRRTTQPYNYVFSDNIPVESSDLADKMVTGEWEIAPIFTNLEITTIATGLASTLTFDLWGPSHHLLHYVRPTTLRLTANGYALITPRANVQSVLHEFTRFYENLILDFAEQGQFPVNGPLEIRISGIDSGSAPALSPIQEIPGKPQYDTTIWIDTLTYPDSPKMPVFMSRLESYLLQNLTVSHGIFVRPEWSKGFGYTDESGWSNWDFLLNFIPRVFGVENWTYCCQVFKKYDPFQVFTNSFLRQLLQPID